MTSKYGFSVVAPISVTSPSSTAGSSASCCALLKRWISSRKKIVGSPLAARRWSARSNSCSTLEFWQPRAHILARAVPEPEQLERRTTELLQRLIRFNTVNPPGQEGALQEHLRELLAGAGFECELLSAVDGRPSLVARLRGRSDGPVLSLSGHVDTVLARPSEWSVDPWSGELRDDCVWGRGPLAARRQVAVR